MIRGDGWRPRRRGDCADVPRPCPFVGCRYNLYLDVLDRGRVRRRVPPDVAPEDIDPAWSCALDVAARGKHQVGQIADLLGLTTPRVSQIIDRATKRLRVIEDEAERTIDDYDRAT